MLVLHGRTKTQGRTAQGANSRPCAAVAREFELGAPCTFRLPTRNAPHYLTRDDRIRRRSPCDQWFVDTGYEPPRVVRRNSTRAPRWPRNHSSRATDKRARCHFRHNQNPYIDHRGKGMLVGFTPSGRLANKAMRTRFAVKGSSIPSNSVQGCRESAVSISEPARYKDVGEETRRVCLLLQSCRPSRRRAREALCEEVREAASTLCKESELRGY